MVNVRNQLLLWRGAKGMSQAMLANRMNSSQYYVSQLEVGARPNPTLHTLQRLADGLGISLKQFMFENPGMELPEAEVLTIKFKEDRE